MSAKVATVEDYDSQVQEAIPASRIQAFRKRQSCLNSVTNYSDAGTVDSGYSSNSAPNGHEEHEPFPESISPSRNTPQSDLSNSAASDRSYGRQSGANGSNLDLETRQANRLSGKYAHAYISRSERPLSRAPSKSERSRDSPAIRPIDTSGCDCPDCDKSSGGAQPSPMVQPPNSSGLESPWPLDMMKSLPYENSSSSWGGPPLSSSPGKRGLGSQNNGFFDTFSTTSSSSNPGPSGRPSSLLSGSNPLASFTSTYDYTDSPTAYTSSSGINPLHSPPPYLGGGDDPAWMSSLNSMPHTPNSLRGVAMDDYLSYPSSHDYLYGPGSGAASATGGNAPVYDLPIRSASVQPPGVRSGRNRSATYGDYNPMGPPPTRRVSHKMPPAPKRIHSANNSFDGRYESSMVPYDRYDTPFDHSNVDDFHGPPQPINRRLSRTATTGPPPLDITRAISVPPADNYIAGLARERRYTSMTPQPRALQNGERNRRGSNSSSGLSAASRRAHEARLAEMVDLVKVEPRPELALTKRESAGAMVRHGYTPDYDYPNDGLYGNYEYPYDNGGMDVGPYHDEYDQDVLSGHSDSLASQYSHGLPPKLHYTGGDPLHRSIRLNSDRRRSVHRRFSDYQHSADPYAHGHELEELRHLTKSRNSGLDRRLAPGPAYIEDGY